MEWLFDHHIWASFISLAVLEIILGIDNVIFVTLAVGHLPEQQRHKARLIGLSLALLMRIVLLFSIVWVISLKEPWLSIATLQLSGKDVLMLLGGLFLLYKGTNSIREEITHEQKSHYDKFSGPFGMTILQVVIIDFIFSADSVITAVGLTDNIPVIIAAMTLAMLVMLLSASLIASFIEQHPTLKMLALSFIMVIGVFLVMEGLGVSIPKGYIYFAMLFSLTVETLNLLKARKAHDR